MLQNCPYDQLEWAFITDDESKSVKQRRISVKAICILACRQVSCSALRSLEPVMASLQNIASVSDG